MDVRETEAPVIEKRVNVVLDDNPDLGLVFPMYLYSFEPNVNGFWE
jgi:hypothetical protein